MKTLADLRRATGLSQHEVADALHIQQQNVSRWECGLGQPSARNVFRLALLYRVSADAIIHTISNSY